MSLELLATCYLGKKKLYVYAHDNFVALYNMRNAEHRNWSAIAYLLGLFPDSSLLVSNSSQTGISPEITTLRSTSVADRVLDSESGALGPILHSAMEFYWRIAMVNHFF